MHKILKTETPLGVQVPLSLDCECSEACIKYKLREYFNLKTEQSFYTFKCSADLSFTHKLRVALCSLMIPTEDTIVSHSLFRRVRLYNMSNDKLWELQSDEFELWKMLQILLSARENPIKTSNTASFIGNCNSCFIASGLTPLLERLRHSMKGYPLLYSRVLQKPHERDEAEFASLPDSEQARIQEWYREGLVDSSPPSYIRWIALLNKQEINMTS